MEHDMVPNTGPSARIPLVSVLAITLFASAASADPTPSVTFDLPSEVKLGEDTNGAKLTFDNSAMSGETGFGPFIDLVIDVTGADGASTEDDDGFTFNAASYLGTNLTTYTRTFPEHFSGTGCVDHPLARDTNLDAYQVCGPSGDMLVVIELPYGSFVPEQPAVDVDLDLSLSDLADTDSALTFYARGGFRFGATALDDPCCDPTLLNPTSSTSSTWTSSSTTPTLMETRVEYNGPEDETATGPNFPRRYDLIIDIADGQTLTDVTLTATIPQTMAFKRVVSSPTGATVTTSPPVDTAPGSGQQDLVIDIPSITGTSSTTDATVVIEVFIPLEDGDNANVIDDNTADDTTSPIDLSVVGDWTPLDVRDPATADNATSNASGYEHTLGNKAIAIQKSVSVANDTNGSGCTPGDTVEYTLDFQVSDYFALDNVEITSIIPDGLRYDSSFTPTIELTRHGVGINDVFDPTHHSITPNYSPDVAMGADGTTTIWFDVSGQLGTLGYESSLRGGCIPNTGTMSVDCSTHDDGATTGTVTFRAIVQEDFSDDYPSGDASVDAGDAFAATVTIDSDVLDNDMLLATMYEEADTSSANISIGRGSLQMSIVAINGVAPSGGTPEVQPGDEVTYRVQYDLPTADVEDLSFDVYLPLPVFDIDEMSTSFTNTVSSANPAAGQTKYGADEDFVSRSGTPTVSLDSAANSIRFDYGDVDDTNSLPGSVDILLTSTVTTDPFADELKLTAQTRMSQGSTNSGGSTSDKLEQIVLRQPVIQIKKGVTDTSHPSATITPGAHFDGATPTSSNALASAPNTGAVTEIDAGDTVDFAIVLENIGGADAYDMIIKDAMPSGLQVPSGGLNLSVKQGDGTTLSYTRLGPGGVDADIFANGIEITDPAESVCQPYNATSGKNIVVVTYTLEVVDSAAIPAAVMANTATLTQYTNEDGGGSGKNHVGDETEYESSTTITIDEPTITHTLTSTSESHTSGDDATVGEELTYTVTLTLPEGTAPTSSVSIALPAELAALSVDSVSASSGLTTSVGSFSSVASGANISGDARTITLDFGTLTNTDRDDASAQTIQIVYTARADDVPATAGGDRVSNSATWTWSAGSVAASASADIVEPVLEITKTSDANKPDEGDTVTYTVQVAHDASSSADAFRVDVADAIPSGLDYVPGSLTSTGALAPDAIAINGSDITVTWDEFPQGSVGEFEYQVTVPVQTQSSTSFSQDADLDWESLDAGDPSRTGDDTAALTITTSAPVLVHSVTSTSVSETGSSEFSNSRQDITPGEEITYTVTATIPEGITPDAVITIDTANSSGEGYIDLLSATLTQVGGNLTTSNTPALVITDDNSDGANDLITLNLGDVTNPQDGSVTDADKIIITYIGRLRAHTSNTDGKNIRNRALLAYSSGSTLSKNARIDAVRPITTPLKSMTGPVDDVVTVTLSAQNTGHATAHEIALSDDLDESIWDVGSLSFTSTPTGYTVSTASNAGTTTITIAADPGASAPANTLEAGEQIDVVFTVPIFDTVRAQGGVDNTLTVTQSTSLEGDSDHELEDAGAQDTATLLLADPTMTKRVEIATNVDGLADPAPGDTLRYTIEIPNDGPGQMSNVVITDLIDADVTMKAGTLLTSSGGTILDGSDAGDSTVSVRFDDIAGWETAFVSFEVTIGTPADEQLSNQGSMTFDEYPETWLSDDTTRPGDEDPVLTDVPLADTPTLSVTSSEATLEDTAVALDITSALTDTDGSEELTVTLTGIPTGATLSAGTFDSGTWTLTAAQLTGLTLTPAEHSDEDFTITVTAIATETSNLHAATNAATIDVTVTAVADTPTLMTSDVSTLEQVPVELPITAGYPDQDGSEAHTVEITGYPAGATFSAGAEVDGKWVVTSAQLTGLTITPPIGGNFTLSLTAKAVESSNDDEATTPGTILVQVSKNDFINSSYPKILVIWDEPVAGSPIGDLITELEERGMRVVASDVQTSSYDGQRPYPNGYDAIVVLFGADKNNAMPATGQTALQNYVSDGGALFLHEWAGAHAQNSDLDAMRELVLFDGDGSSTSSLAISAVSGQSSHDLVAALTLPTTLDGNMSDVTLHTFASDPATLLLEASDSTPMLAVREWGSGRIAHLNSTGNHDGEATWSDADAQDIVAESLFWAMPDSDGDGRKNWGDNCPDDANADQADADADGIGDVCDNCPNTFSQAQVDTDGDGTGDVCDTCAADNPNDANDDSVCDSFEGCGVDPASNDGDDDGVPDSCGASSDNCPNVANTDQADFDNDGVGDLCDTCPLDANDDSDGDGICDSHDHCDGADDNADADGDGIPDACDSMDGTLSTDFAAQGVYLSDDAGDVSLPAGVSSTGHDLVGVGLFYEVDHDLLYIGLDSAGILGDVDGDGDPNATSAALSGEGGVDRASFGSDETIVIVLDTDDDGTGDYILGTPFGFGFSALRFTELAPGFPLAASPLAFGDTLETSKLLPVEEPDADNPDPIFGITNASQLFGSFDEDAYIGIWVYSGASSDDPIGEDFFPSVNSFERVRLGDMSSTATLNNAPKVRGRDFAWFGNYFSGSPNWDFLPLGARQNGEVIMNAPLAPGSPALTAPIYFDRGALPSALTAFTNSNDFAIAAGDPSDIYSELYHTDNGMQTITTLHETVATNGPQNDDNGTALNNIDMQTYRVITLECTHTLEARQDAPIGQILGERFIGMTHGDAVEYGQSEAPVIVNWFAISQFDEEGELDIVHEYTPEEYLVDYEQVLCIDPTFTHYSFLDRDDYTSNDPRVSLTPSGGVELPAGTWVINTSYWTWANTFETSVEVTFTPGEDCTQ